MSGTSSKHNINRDVDHGPDIRLTSNELDANNFLNFYKNGVQVSLQGLATKLIFIAIIFEGINNHQRLARSKVIRKFDITKDNCNYKYISSTYIHFHRNQS